MSTKLSINSNENSERPISIYDNLSPTMPPSHPTSNNCQKKDNKIMINPDDLPFSTISFKFDDDYNNSIPRENENLTKHNNKLNANFIKTPNSNNNFTSSSSSTSPLPLSLPSTSLLPEENPQNFNNYNNHNNNFKYSPPSSLSSSGPETNTPPPLLPKSQPPSQILGTNGNSNQHAQQDANKHSDTIGSDQHQNDHYHHHHHQQHQQQQQQQQQQQNQQFEHQQKNISTTDSSIENPKPVISDAKSKFFGLKNNHNSSMDSSESTKLIDISDKDLNFEVINAQRKYQNIPSNSAVFNEDVHGHGDNYVGLITDDEVIDGSNIHCAKVNDTDQDEVNRSDNDTDINHPSQVVYMSTTVPQNIKGSNIAGRHTPTRNSLRHSRMLVVNKNYQGDKAPNPLNLRHPMIARVLLILQILFGVLLTFIGIWILLWAPNTRIQDNPYWSGLSLTFAGIVGIIVIRFKRIKRQKFRESCFTFLKVDSYLLTISAIILCFIALICASIHLSKLIAETTKCISTNILIANAACICKFGVTETKNITTSTLTEENFIGNHDEFQYRDLSCGEVTGAWKYILLVNIVLNSLGFLVSTIYLMLLFNKKKNKNKKKSYSNVRSADPF